MAGMVLPGLQREVLRVVVERGLEKIWSVCFSTTIPQICGWMAEEGVPGSRDTVERTLRTLQGMGIATRTHPHIHEGYVRLAASWQIDFGGLLPEDFSEFSLPQNAALLETKPSTKISKKPTGTGRQDKQRTRTRRAGSVSPAHDPQWDDCLALLRGTGERLGSRTVEKKLTSSGRAPGEALPIIAGALEQAADRKTKGEPIRSVVGYALSALPVGGWGEVFLRPTQAESKALESLGVAPDETLAAAAMLAEEIGITARDAKDEVARVVGAIRQEGLVAAVEIAISLARKRAASGHVDSFGGLVRHFLRGAQAPEINMALSRARWARECVSQAQAQAWAQQQALQAAMGLWGQVADPLRSNSEAQAVFESWQRLRSQSPASDSPGYLEHFDAERRAHRALVSLAEAALGPKAEEMRRELIARLAESGIQPDSKVWKLAWEHHWSRQVWEHWGLAW